MPIRLRTGPVWGLGSLGTTRILSIATSPATFVVMSTGYQALEAVNVGSANLYYGFSTVAVGSGTELFTQSQTPRWDRLEDAWGVYVVAESVAGILTVHEYR